jgi:hypothetical protein
MTKQDLADLLGAEFLKDIASTMGVTKQAVSSWRDPLTPAVEARVVSYLWRIRHPLAPDRRRSRSALAA